MENIILETNSLCKRFKNTYALDNVSLKLYKNHIYGFIGENGAGKSTFMKIISGLAFPTSGEFTLMGESSAASVERQRRKVGTMIEQPALYPNYTIKQNVELQRIVVGNPDTTATERVIEMVGLTDDMNKKAKNLSMGMKQRLGIAIAMVGDPKFLILDEPINGLDPKNIVSLRKLLKKLNEESPSDYSQKRRKIAKRYIYRLLPDKYKSSSDMIPYASNQEVIERMKEQNPNIRELIEKFGLEFNEG